MQLYTAEQVRAIRSAIGAARRQMLALERFAPVDFARIFVQHHGVQIPGHPEHTQLAAVVASKLLQSLEMGAKTHTDTHVARELHRASVESDWAALAHDDQVVGVRVLLSAESDALTLCRMALERDFGLGAGVVPPTRILVLAPACQDYSIEPVTVHDIEQ